MKSRGFTLIELLVVTAVIGLLMGLLIPALSRSRQQALRLNCAVHLRSVGLGLSLYQQDYRRLPPLYDRWGPERQTYDTRHLEPWITYVAFHRDEVEEPNTLAPLQLAYLARSHQIKDPGTFYCPGQVRLGDHEPYSYAYYTEGGRRWGTFLPIRTNGIPDDKIRTSFHYWLHGEKTLDRLSDRPVVFDNIQHWNSVAHRTAGRPMGINALFGDGHVHFSTGESLFDRDLWNGGPAAGPWDGPGNDLGLFTAIIDRLTP
jgi:prepilin-type N-terminal cleavage/methylation domain-containing protein/prepilin-type processing-associated H-X9-DG protein